MQTFVTIPSRVKQAKKQASFYKGIKVKSFKEFGKKFYSPNVSAKVDKANDQLGSEITNDLCNDDGLNSF